jgi:hypothetical protein
MQADLSRSDGRGFEEYCIHVYDEMNGRVDEE